MRSFALRNKIVPFVLGFALWQSGCASVPAAPAGSCQLETGIPGPEDLVLDEFAKQGPRLIVSSQQRRAHDAAGVMRFTGGLFSLPLLRVGNKSAQLGEAQRLLLRNRDDLAFHPVGLDLRVQADGSRRLYVVNRPAPGRSVVEIYELRDRQAIFRQRLEDPLLVSANDLVALDDDELYVTNDLIGPAWRASLDTLLGLAVGNVVHYRQGQWQLVIDHLAFANGITLSPAGDHLYVAEMRAGTVRDYSRDPVTGRLNAKARVFRVPGNVDNLSWENSTWLNVASHPDLLALAASMDDVNKRAPTQTYRLNIKTGELRPLFFDDGQQVSAASVAMRVGDRVILGQLLDDGVANCRAMQP